MSAFWWCRDLDPRTLTRNARKCAGWMYSQEAVTLLGIDLDTTVLHPKDDGSGYVWRIGMTVGVSQPRSLRIQSSEEVYFKTPAAAIMNSFEVGRRATEENKPRSAIAKEIQHKTGDGGSIQDTVHKIYDTLELHSACLVSQTLTGFDFPWLDYLAPEYSNVPIRYADTGMLLKSAAIPTQIQVDETCSEFYERVNQYPSPFKYSVSAFASQALVESGAIPEPRDKYSAAWGSFVSVVMLQQVRQLCITYKDTQ